MYLGHVSGRKVVPDCRRLGSSASDCRLQKGYLLGRRSSLTKFERQTARAERAGSQISCVLASTLMSPRDYSDIPRCPFVVVYQGVLGVFKGGYKAIVCPPNFVASH